MSKQRRLLEEEDEDDVMLPKREYDTFIFIFHISYDWWDNKILE